MKCAKRRVVRRLALAGIALLSAAAPARVQESGPVTADRPASLTETGPISAIRPEVRLRKLHLVRPDLIPYPIASEIYC